MRPLRLLAALCLFAPAAGCGNNRGLAPVTGVVKHNGQPLANAYVAFWPDQPGARGATATTDGAGRYHLTTFEGNDGAVIGKHRVSIRAEAEPEGPRLAADDIRYKRGKLLTPPRYSDPEKSGLAAEVAAGRNTFDFDVKD